VAPILQRGPAEPRRNGQPSKVSLRTRSLRLQPLKYRFCSSHTDCSVSYNCTPFDLQRPSVRSAAPLHPTRALETPAGFSVLDRLPANSRQRFRYEYSKNPTPRISRIPIPPLPLFLSGALRPHFARSCHVAAVPDRVSKRVRERNGSVAFARISGVEYLILRAGNHARKRPRHAPIPMLWRWKVGNCHPTN
jgi:hypothetical protein